jgi:hypothetical protein
VRITEKEWELLETRVKASGSRGFVAMKFKDMDPVYEAIKAGIAGCAPQKVRPPRDRGFFPSGAPALPCPATQHGKPRATVITFLHLLRDLVLAFVAPRTTLVAENLLLRQQVVVLSRQVKRPPSWLPHSSVGIARDHAALR